MTHIHQQELASWLDLTARRVRELTASGVLTQGPKGYDVRASVISYVRFLRTEPGNLTDERARLTKAQADLAELKVRVRSGELVSRDATEKAWFTLARTTRDNFQNLPARTAGLVAAEKNQDACFAILSTEVNQILEGLTREA